VLSKTLAELLSEQGQKITCSAFQMQLAKTNSLRSLQRPPVCYSAV